MLESQLPSFNRPPTKPSRGRPESEAATDKPAPTTGPETPAGDLAQQESTPNPPSTHPESVGPVADGYATLDPNVVAPTERDPGSAPAAPPVEFHGTLQLPNGVSENPAHVADRLQSAVEVQPGEEEVHGSDTLVKVGGKSTPVLILPVMPGYHILGELGKGGMGIVYKAMQAGLNRLVALKMIRKDRATDDAVTRFQDEAKAVARLRHPNIVQIYDIGEHEGSPYFSLEYIDGGSLDRHIKGNPQLPRASARLVRTLARAMNVAHEQNIVHRDLKPGNVLVQVAPGGAAVDETHIDPDKLIPKITDFGLAKQLDNAELSQTHSGAVLGTPYYMAPEQAEGWLREIQPWTDVYALGAILYELLTGRPPFKGATLVETLDQVRHLDPVPPRVLQPSVPKDLETICLKCLQKQPQARYVNGGELADDLDRFLQDRPILARPIGWRERAVKWAKRSPMAAAAVGVTVLLVLSLIGTLSVLMSLSRQELAEQRRQEQARSLYEASMSEANAKAQQAIRDNDPEQWQQVLALVKNAYTILDSHDMTDADSLRARTDRLFKQADAEVKGARERAQLREQARERRKTLRACHDTALVHSALYTGLTGEQNYEEVDRQLKTALALYGINPAEPEQPTLDPDFYTAPERRQVIDWYYAMLLFQAEATYLRATAGKADDEARRRVRIRQAIEQLNRADRFLARDSGKAAAEPPRTNASLQLLCTYLQKIGATRELEQAREQLTQTKPERPLDLFIAARSRFMDPAESREQAEKAREDVMKLAGRALDIDPDYFGARYFQTICHLQEGNLQVARDYLTTCLKEQKDFIWLQLLRGFVWMQMGDLGNAAQDFNAARNHPNPKIRYVALVNSSALATRLQDWDGARLALAEAIAVMEVEEKKKKDDPDGPDDAAAHFPYSKYLILLDPSVTSMTALAAAAHEHKGDGSSTTAYINLAMVNKKRADMLWGSSLALLKPLLGSAASTAVGESVPLRLQVRRAALEEAVSALDRALAEKPSTPGLLHSERGRLHLELEDYERARGDFATVVRLAREAGDAGALSERATRDRLSLAELLFRSGAWQDTITECQDLLKRSPEQLQAYRLQARAELELNRNAEARQTLEQYLHHAIRQGIERVAREEMVEVYVTQGLLAAKVRDYRAAADSYTQGLQLYGRAERSGGKFEPAARRALGQLYSLRGWAYLGEDVASLAGKDFDEALGLDPRNVDARLGKAESLVRQDKLAEAVSAAEEARTQARQSSRALFGAARVHAMAYGLADRGKRPEGVTEADAARWGERAIELLREALDQETPDRRAAFWKQYIAADTAFNPLRGQPAMRRLEQETTGPPR